MLKTESRSVCEKVVILLYIMIQAKIFCYKINQWKCFTSLLDRLLVQCGDFSFVQSVWFLLLINHKSLKFIRLWEKNVNQTVTTFFELISATRYISIYLVYMHDLNWIIVTRITLIRFVNSVCIQKLIARKQNKYSIKITRN